MEWNPFERHWPLCGEFTGFHSQRPVTRRFCASFDLRLNKRLSQQYRRWWFETPSRSLWRRFNAYCIPDDSSGAMILYFRDSNDSTGRKFSWPFTGHNQTPLGQKFSINAIFALWFSLILFEKSDIAPYLPTSCQYQVKITEFGTKVVKHSIFSCLAICVM